MIKNPQNAPHLLFHTIPKHPFHSQSSEIADTVQTERNGRGFLKPPTIPPITESAAL